MAERAEDFQVELALRAFSVLCALAEDLGRKDWAGALMVGCGLGPGGPALALAGNIAGAGCLAIEAQAAVCRAALRSGACDFVVNSVDEALRILKNEIRQRRPVSVGLAMEPNAALKELMERGVAARGLHRVWCGGGRERRGCGRCHCAGAGRAGFRCAEVCGARDADCGLRWIAGGVGGRRGRFGAAGGLHAGAWAEAGVVRVCRRRGAARVRRAATGEDFCDGRARTLVCGGFEVLSSRTAASACSVSDG